LANGPVAATAIETLEARGVHVIPDIIANAGGVVVSYLEMVQNQAGEHWSEAQVHKKLEQYMVSSLTSVLTDAAHDHVSLTDAAYALALGRLA
jgi:glutamate dehydrogenase/leucine dehydrogenase